MKCRVCQAKAMIKIERHHTAFCPICFTDYVHKQVERAVADERMFTRSEEILLAVSGGKDSLALWEILIKLGYKTAGLHVDLGIGDYSRTSRAKAERFAESRGAKLIVHDLPNELGAGIPQIAEKTDRPPCSACGLVKRYSFNQIALEKGFSVVATGHNLDDEAARLLGNVLHWQEEYLDKQSPVLPAAHEKLVKKVKPLYRLAEREIAAYSIMNRIEYIVEECPNATGAKLLVYKDVLNRLEENAPGTKHNFYLTFLRRRSAGSAEFTEGFPTCQRCGQPTQAGGAARRKAANDSGESALAGATASAPAAHPSSSQENGGARSPLCGYCRLMERVHA